jgi:hypothetical protein
MFIPSWSQLFVFVYLFIIEVIVVALGALWCVFIRFPLWGILWLCEKIGEILWDVVDAVDDFFLDLIHWLNKRWK